MLPSLLLSVLALVPHVCADAPVLDLPWGKWQASVSQDDENVYVFKNVRFGDEPVRFNRSSFPTTTTTGFQDSATGAACIQIDPSELKNSPGGKHPIGDPASSQSVVAAQSEDCLFLDVYVPVSAFNQDSPSLPVVVWFFGGAFAFGSKDPGGSLYTGEALLQASNYNTIFVAGNYRLGALGWLAGSYMQENGQPNAGLYDQNLVLQWVQRFIEQVNGNKDSVSAWGESAGAGSILHHLIRQDGAVDPLFKTFAVQSPAFQWAWNNSAGGQLDETFQDFCACANCTECNMDCLRSEELDVAKANTCLYANYKTTGLFPVGPSVDGDWITTIPTVAFSQDKFFKGISSNIISHCSNESGTFIPKSVYNESGFDNFLEDFLPGDSLKTQRDEIKTQYNCAKTYKGDYYACIGDVIRDSSFTCNTRDLNTAYPSQSYMMEYAFPLKKYGFHGSDIIPLFVAQKDEIKALLLKLKPDLSPHYANLYADALVTWIGPRYRNYFASFAVHGQPNAMNPFIQWPVASQSGGLYTSVLQAHLPIGLGKAFTLLNGDKQNGKDRCAFWTKLAGQIVGSSDKEEVEGVPYLQGEL